MGQVYGSRRLRAHKHENARAGLGVLGWIDVRDFRSFADIAAVLAAVADERLVARSAPPAGWVFAVRGGLLGGSRDFGCGRVVGLRVPPAAVVGRRACRSYSCCFGK